MRNNILRIIPLFMILTTNAQQIGDGLAPGKDNFIGAINSGVYSGINAIGGIPDTSHDWSHLFVIRHGNPNNVFQLQIASSYTENDRLFFRKTRDELNPVWMELATRGKNSFVGDQIFNGNIGIGTTPPRAVLDITKTTGNGILSTVFARLSEGDNIGDGTFLGVRAYGTSVIEGKSFSIEHSFYNVTNSSINFLRGGSTSGGGISFNTNDNKEQMRIDYFGNVGIGTLTPKNKLDVNGTIHSKEVKVDMTGWSDFVFKKEYSLPTLTEVENHIKEKGHLENIPSEEEVLKNGINLGEMNVKLLQKIEELTLYSIQQSKEIEILKEENKLFKALSERLSKVEQKIK